MNLLFVSHSRDVSGGEICLQRIVENLKDHSVLVVLPEGAFSRQLAGAGVSTHIENELITMSRREDPLAFFKLMGRWPGLVSRLSRKMHEFRADLVISNAMGPLPYAGPAARWARVPNVCIHHHPVLQPGSSNAKLVFLLSKFCDGFIAVSEAMNRGLQLSGVPAGRIKTIYNGLDLAEFLPDESRSNLLRSGLLPETQLIGLVGTLFEAKGQHIVIEAARQLRDEFQVSVLWRVVFIGDVFENSRLGNEHKARLQQQIENTNLQDLILFAGRQGNMRNVYRDLDIVLNASIEPEPLGTTIYEAMAMKRIAIATNLGGSPEIIEDGKSGFLVPPGDNHALAETLARILRREIDLDPIRTAGRKRVEERFDLRDTMRRYIGYFKSFAKDK